MIRMLKEIVLLVIVGTTLAVLANAVRANPAIKGHLSWGRNYFKKITLNPSNKNNDMQINMQTSVEKSLKTPSNSLKSQPPIQPAHPEHGFQVIAHKDVVALLDDPNTQAYLNIFVDARNDDAFEKGHIPGAIQADHYQLEMYVDDLMQFAPAADKIVVYCNGGECEDSIFMCQDLLELGIDPSVLFLYEGGWKAWEASSAPIETGR